MASRARRHFGTIRQLPSVGSRSATPPPTASGTPRQARSRPSDAEAWVTDRRREIDRGIWDRPTKQARAHHVRCLRSTLAGQPAGRGRPIKARTREHYQNILDDHLLDTFGNRQLGAIKPKDVREWYSATLTDRPTMRSHAYSAVAHHHGAAPSVDELIDANPARIVGAGRAKRVHKIRPGFRRGAGRADCGDARAASAHGHPRVMVCASVRRRPSSCAAATSTRRTEVIRIRRAAVRTKGAYTITTPKI